MSDQKKLSEEKIKKPTESYRLLNMNTFIHDMLADEIKNFKSNENIKSGYSNLDGITNLYPGFYVLGAIPSLGKTTFILQMADQLATAGNPVLFFSMEQSALELASKSLSRIMAISNADKALTSLEIRKNKNNQLINDAISKYGEYAGKLTIYECSFSATIDDIEKAVNDYLTREHEKPIVIIDYLQVIQPSKGSNKSTKDIVDSHVRRLKQLQSDNKLVLIAISSLNRQNYLFQIDYESFKESGGIEYTADVVWGLQLQILHDAEFEKSNNINDKRQKLQKAKAENPRKVELVCLKNRFGKSSYTCSFDYYPQFDWFKPVNN